jgi:ERCC4-related helicase
MKRVIPEKDQKLQDLLEIIKNKVNNPINPNNKKIIIFSAFADTVNYLYTNLSTTCKESL